MPDTTPDAFTFTDLYGAHPSLSYTSNEITVTGIDAASAITITGGTYSKNGAAYTASAGTVLVGDKVTVKGTADYAWATAVNVALTIGGVSDTFTITTMSAPEVASTTPTSGSPYILTKDSWIF